MRGAIIGDVVGSVFEWSNYLAQDFILFADHDEKSCRFTDDSVCTLGIAAALVEYLQNQPTYPEPRFADHLRIVGKAHRKAGYGGMYGQWLDDTSKGPYNSWGNGSAMRVSPVGWLARNESEVSSWAAASAAVTHDHPDGIFGAELIALAIWWFRQGCSVEDVRARLQEKIQRRQKQAWLSERSIDEICQYNRTLSAAARFDVSCVGTVPVALQAVFEASSVEDALRRSICVGGDSDTISAIAGSVAEARFFPHGIKNDDENGLWMRTHRLLSADLQKIDADFVQYLQQSSQSSSQRP